MHSKEERPGIDPAWKKVSISTGEMKVTVAWDDPVHCQSGFADFLIN